MKKARLSPRMKAQAERKLQGCFVGNCNHFFDLSKAGIQCNGFSYTNEVNAPHYSDAEINFHIARLELQKEEAVAHLDKLIEELKGALVEPAKPVNTCDHGVAKNLWCPKCAGMQRPGNA